MKRYIPLTFLLLVGCSSVAPDGGTITFPPPPTMNIHIVDTTPIRDEPFTDEELAFVDDVYFLYGSYPLMNAGELVQMGELWCQLMTDGMTADDVMSRINEGASDNDDAKLHYSIVLAGGENLCKDLMADCGRDPMVPDHLNPMCVFESIALRYLTL